MRRLKMVAGVGLVVLAVSQLTGCGCCIGFCDGFVRGYDSTRNVDAAPSALTNLELKPSPIVRAAVEAQRY